jgi:hypothetical protein
MIDEPLSLTRVSYSRSSSACKGNSEDSQVSHLPRRRHRDGGFGHETFSRILLSNESGLVEVRFLGKRPKSFFAAQFHFGARAAGNRAPLHVLRGDQILDGYAERPLASNANASAWASIAPRMSISARQSDSDRTRSFIASASHPECHRAGIGSLEIAVARECP